MKQNEFNRLVLHGTWEDLEKAMRDYPDLLENCAEQIRASMDDMVTPIDDGLWYQRMVDRGLEDVEEYDYIDDIDDT